MKYLLIIFAPLILFSCSDEDNKTAIVDEINHTTQDTLVPSEETNNISTPAPIERKVITMDSLWLALKHWGYSIDSNQFNKSITFYPTFQHYEGGYIYDKIDSLIKSPVDSSYYLRIIIDSTNTTYSCIDIIYGQDDGYGYLSLFTHREIEINKQDLYRYVKNPIHSKQYFIGDGYFGFYKIGHYKNGIKHGIWFTSYEDYILPKFEVYNKGEATNGQHKFELRDDKNRIWVKGKLLTNNHMRFSKWGKRGSGYGVFSSYDYYDNVRREYEFLGLGNDYPKDSLVVFIKTYKLSDNKIINSEERLYYNYEKSKQITNGNHYRNEIFTRLAKQSLEQHNKAFEKEAEYYDSTLDTIEK